LDGSFKDSLEKFNGIKEKFELNIRQWRSNPKLTVNSLFEKSINFFYELIQKSANIPIIVRLSLDFECRNLLVEKNNLFLKTLLDLKHFGKNTQIQIQNIYSYVLEDLKQLFEFYRWSYVGIYKLEVSAEQEKQFNEDSPNYISNALNFIGKKLKLVLNQKFYSFKDLINLEGDNKKDAEDAIKFFNNSLNNNLYNARVYNNLALIYNEFLEDHLNSIYWYIYGLNYSNEKRFIFFILDFFYYSFFI